MELLRRAIIVAAGEGSRLRPVTLTTPKPLVKVNGVRMIDTIIQALKQNGIHEIYIVTGYKKEQFYDVYKKDSSITVLENPYYLDGNNVTSLYVARDYLPGAFVIEGDLNVRNPEIFNPVCKRSGYFASYMDKASEWALTLRDGIICSCSVKGGEHCYRLWGVSMWTSEDGRKLAKLVKQQVEQIRDWSIFWDELALFKKAEEFKLGIREVGLNDLYEIDSFDELVNADLSYRGYI